MMGQMQEKDKCWRSDCWRAYQCSLKGLDHSVLQMFLLFIFLVSDSLEGQGEFVNEENPFLIGAFTGAVRVSENDFGTCECVNA